MKLTPKHMNILELYCGDAVAVGREELAEMAGVSRATVQRLLRKPEAKQIIRELTDERQALSRSAILDKIDRQARAGCTASQKLSCQINGDVSTGGHTTTVNVTQTTEPLDERTAAILDKRKAVLAKNES